MSLALEMFDFEHEKTATKEEHTPLYKMGYDAGYEAAIAQMTQEQTLLKAELVQMLSDINFSYIDARFHLLQQMSGVFEAVLSTLLPATSLLSLRESLLEMVTEALKRDCDTPILLCSSAQDFDALQIAIAQSEFSTVTLEVDPILEPGALIFKTSETETALDLSGALEQISTALSSMREMLSHEEQL